MAILSLLAIELLKTKRSLALLMLVVTPLSVVLLSLMMFLHADGAHVAEKGWGLFWLGNFSLWGVFMLPLYITLITVLLNQIDHKDGGWRLMLSLPISRISLFIAKLLQAFIYLFVANMTLVILIYLSQWLLQLVGFNGAGLDSVMLALSFIIKATLAGMGILIIQQLLAWRFKNFIIPLAAGVIGTFSVLQMASSAYWYLNPWSYTLVATNSSDLDRSELGIIYSISLFTILLIVSIFYIRRLEVRT